MQTFEFAVNQTIMEKKNPDSKLRNTFLCLYFLRRCNFLQVCVTLPCFALLAAAVKWPILTIQKPSVQTGASPVEAGRSLAPVVW